MKPKPYQIGSPRHLWYKDAIIYCLDVETFQDGNGDGIGDFHGLLERIDYISGLGVTCLWLLPFFPTPNRDNGYDVVDYYGVDPRLGTPGDLVEFMREAHERGLRIIIDLPVNHTSREHPWFQQARRDPESRFRDFYVWSDEKPEDAHEGMVFPGVQETTWSYDRVAKKYYFHRFYDHQPDLNIANPAVREEITRIMGYWVELGVSGFRLDAAPFLIELKGIPEAVGEDPYEYLKEFRTFLSWRRGDAILLAEANVAPDQIDDYFGQGQKMHMLFNFLVNQHLFLALARADRTPLVKALHMTPAIPPDGQWAQFLRNHDELDLGRLTEVQRGAVFDAFAPDPDMRLYDRGIRRRLAPMLDGDADRLRMAHSMLLTLPGTPVIRYGSEIGMGEDLSLDERNAVRTVMQWNDQTNAGFSPADPGVLPRPAIRDGEFGYEKLNVEEQQRRPDSLLNWMERAIRARKRAPELGRGNVRILETDQPAVLAHLCSMDGGGVIAIHNFADAELRVTVDVSGIEGDELQDLLGSLDHQPLEPELTLDLPRYGYRWLRATSSQDG